MAELPYWPVSLTCAACKVTEAFFWSDWIGWPVPVASLLIDSHFQVESSIYADDIALLVRGPPQSLQSARLAHQRALDTAAAHLSSVGLAISVRKMEAILLHPRAAAWLHLEDVQIP